MSTLDKKIACEGKESGGAKHGTSANTKREHRSYKRGAKTKALKVIRKDEAGERGNDGKDRRGVAHGSPARDLLTAGRRR